MKRTIKYYRIIWLRHDLPAGLSVFLVALPLCLGIALASGAPLYSGLLSGIIGGLLVALISGLTIGSFRPCCRPHDFGGGFHHFTWRLQSFSSCSYGCRYVSTPAWAFKAGSNCKLFSIFSYQRHVSGNRYSPYYKTNSFSTGL